MSGLRHTPVGIAARYSQNTPASEGTMSPKTEVGPGLSYYLAGARNLRLWGDDPAEGENQARLQLQCML